MINMQGFSLLDIMSKSYKKGMNEMDSAGVGIVGMCITACFMELWVTVFALNFYHPMGEEIFVF